MRAPCVFGDVEGCIPPGSYDPKDCFMQKFHSIARADLVSHNHCYTHNGQCPLFEKRKTGQLETAGLPCIDQSKAGNRLFEEGPTSTVFAAHAKRHIELETWAILLENVQAGHTGKYRKILFLFLVGFQAAQPQLNFTLKG